MGIIQAVKQTASDSRKALDALKKAVNGKGGK